MPQRILSGPRRSVGTRANQRQLLIREKATMRVGRSLAFGRSALNAVEIVCRHVHPRVAGIAAVVDMIETCIGVAAHWTVASASASAGFCAKEARVLRFLMRVAASEPRDSDPLAKHKHFSDALETEMGCGRFQCVKWLVEEYMPAGRVRHLVVQAARTGKLGVIQWLHEYHFDRVSWNHEEVNAAVNVNHFATAKWLWEHGSRICSVGDGKSALSLIESATRVDLDLAEWLLEACGEDPETRLRAMAEVMKQAAAFGCIADLQVIQDRYGIAPTSDCFIAAVKFSNTSVCEWLKSTGAADGVEPSELSEAIRSHGKFFGGWRGVEWVIENSSAPVDKIDCFSSLVATASWQGNLAVVKYLYERWPKPCSTEATAEAARRGHFKIVKWLDKTEMRGEGGIDNAAHGGHLEIIEWLHHSIPSGACTTKAMDWAAAENHLDVVKWLHINRSEGCTTDAMDNAAAGGHLEVVKWLHLNRREGCTKRAMDGAARSGHFDVVNWLHEHRHEGCSAAALASAAYHGDLKLVLWLHRNRREGITEQAVTNAVIGGHVAVVERLLTMEPALCVTGAVESAVLHGQIDALLAIHRAGRIELPLTPGLARAARGGHCELLQFLVREYSAQRPGLADFLRDAARDAPYGFPWDSSHVLECLQ